MATAHPIPTHPRFHNLTGKRFGRLVVLAFTGFKTGNSLWDCRCDCGTTKNIRSNSMISGKTTSCGCVHREQLGAMRRTHGLSTHPLYARWKHMVARCHDPESPAYKDYGARGIRVCERWRNSVAAFIEDMGEPPTPKHEIDRFPDNDGNYEPGNCRWATDKEQMRNARINRLVTYNGETLCLAAWAEKLGINWYTLRERLDHGWPIELAFTTKPNRLNRWKQLSR